MAYMKSFAIILTKYLVRFYSLIALKVLVGINLLGYAYKRYASMQAREEEERKKDELYAEMDKDEKVGGRPKLVPCVLTFLY
jgi:hypothetical protein